MRLLSPRDHLIQLIRPHLRNLRPLPAQRTCACDWMPAFAGMTVRVAWIERYLPPRPVKRRGRVTSQTNPSAHLRNRRNLRLLPCQRTCALLWTPTPPEGGSDETHSRSTTHLRNLRNLRLLPCQRTCALPWTPTFVGVTGCAMRATCDPPGSHCRAGRCGRRPLVWRGVRGGRRR